MARARPAHDVGPQRRPGPGLARLPLLTVMFVLVGALSLLMGLLAELVVRTYYESQDKRPYLVAEELNRPEKTLPRAVAQS